jgi:hypothetical protein
VFYADKRALKRKLYNIIYRIILPNIEEHAVNEQSEVIFDGISCRKLAVLCALFLQLFW